MYNSCEGNYTILLLITSCGQGCSGVIFNQHLNQHMLKKFIMAERRFLSQYIAVSREKRLTISVSDVQPYFLFLTFVQLFGSKLKQTIVSVLVNFQDKNSRGVFCVMNAALQKKKNWKIHFYITEINFKLQSRFLFSLKVELIMLLAKVNRLKSFRWFLLTFVNR